MAEKFELPEEVVEVRYLKKSTGLIKDPAHIAYGGLMDGSIVSLPANVHRNGKYKNVLTNDEKKYLEGALNLDENGLSIYKKGVENYWAGVKVKLTNGILILNLQDPEEYIQLKVLESYSDLVAPNLESSTTKKTYKYVIVRSGDEAKIALVKLDKTKTAYKLLGKIEDSRDAMIDYLLVTDIKVSPDTDVDTLRSKVGEDVVNHTQRFVDTLTDPSFNTRVLLKRSLIAGNIVRKGNHYYNAGGDALAEPNQQATLENVINFLEANMNQEYRVLLQTKLKETK